MAGLTHFDGKGAARMVDVADKPATDRRARAGGHVRASAKVLAAIESGATAKGDVLQVARLAGIMAAKKTGELIPLCHPLPLEGVTVDFTIDHEGGKVDIMAAARLTGRTGVEMEALAAVSLAALTIYDMCKSLDRGMEIGGIRLLAKSGGRSGDWTADDPA